MYLVIKEMGFVIYLRLFFIIFKIFIISSIECKYCWYVWGENYCLLLVVVVIIRVILEISLIFFEELLKELVMYLDIYIENLVFYCRDICVFFFIVVLFVIINK